MVSIRSPHQSKGRRMRELADGTAAAVSIRSPHQSKGRHKRPLQGFLPSQFQSAPLTKARGDPQGCRRTLPRGPSFNPLPSPKQGETRWCMIFMSRGTEFQSAPLTKARGDTIENPADIADLSFNPLPSPKQGETRNGSAGGHVCSRVSIRSPHQSKGRQIVQLRGRREILVSIRSPHQSKGRPVRGSMH